MDIDTIPPGADFGRVVEDRISSSDVVLALIGKHWLSATDTDGRRRLDKPEDWVRLELESALNRADVRVIPTLVGGADPPSSDDLPAGLEALARRHAFELSDARWPHDVEHLVHELGGATTVDEPRSRKRAPGRVVLVGIAIVLLLAAAAAVGIFALGGDGSPTPPPGQTNKQALKTYVAETGLRGQILAAVRDQRRRRGSSVDRGRVQRPASSQVIGVRMEKTRRDLQRQISSPAAGTATLARRRRPPPGAPGRPGVDRRRQRCSARSAFRLRIGVTGHRTLHDEEHLTTRLREALDRIRALLGPTRATHVVFTVVSPLAEGADRLVAREVLRTQDARLEAVLPIRATSISSISRRRRRGRISRISWPTRTASTSSRAVRPRSRRGVCTRGTGGRGSLGHSHRDLGRPARAGTRRNRRDRRLRASTGKASRSHPSGGGRARSRATGPGRWHVQSRVVPVARLLAGARLRRARGPRTWTPCPSAVTSREPILAINRRFWFTADGLAAWSLAAAHPASSATTWIVWRRSAAAGVAAAASLGEAARSVGAASPRRPNRVRPP